MSLKPFTLLAILILSLSITSPLARSSRLENAHLALGENLSCAYNSSQTWCWGYNGRGSMRPMPIPELGGLFQIRLGGLMGCGLTQQRHVICWDNQLSTHEISKVSQVSQLTVGWGHACARLFDGELYCWGMNGHGQLGRKLTPENLFDPFLVTPFNGVFLVSAGETSTAVVGLNGHLLTWGSSSKIHLPRVPFPWQISSGRDHHCLLKDHLVQCAGQNDYGQLGENLEQLPPIKSLGSGANHNCILSLGGKVYCWGSNHFGQLGVSLINKSKTPVEVSGLDHVVELAVGYFHNCALKNDGTVWCWGSNSFEKLGVDSPDLVEFHPKQVLGLPLP